jgi:porin
MCKIQVIDRGSNHLGWFYGLVLGLSLLTPNPGWAVHLQEHLDEWNPLRSHLAARGVTLESVNTTDTGSNIRSEGNTKALIIGDIDLLLTLNTEKLIGWKGGTMFLYGLGLYGGNIAEGRDAQGVSNISSKNIWKLFEAWYQQNMFQERLSILAGLYDVTSEFDVISSASELFVNSSFGTNPTLALSGKNGPSTFPNAALGFRAQAKLTENVTLRAVVADGVPGNPPDDPDTMSLKLRHEDGILFTTEAAYYVGKPDPQQTVRRNVGAERPRRLVFRRLGRAAELQYDAKYALGGWFYTTDLDDLSERDRAGDPVKRNGTYGIYGVAEQLVYRERGPREQGLWIFGEAAYANPKVNRFSHYFGGGLVYKGLIPGRDFDETGFGFAIARNSSHYKDGQRQEGKRVADQEVALELTHAIHLSQALMIQPDIQYIIHPNTDPTRNNALVLIMRLELTLNWFK